MSEETTKEGFEDSSGGDWLPVRAAALETGVSARTIYARVSRGAVSSRRSPKGELEVDCDQLRRDIQSEDTPTDDPPSGHSTLVGERNKIEVLRLQMEREEVEAQLRRERLDRELREQELEHARRLAEQERVFKQQMQLEQRAFEVREQQLKSEQLQLQMSAERDKRFAHQSQQRAIEKQQDRERALDAGYEEACATLERVLTVLMTQRNGFLAGQKLRVVIRHLVEEHRARRDVEGVQLHSVLAFREL